MAGDAGGADDIADSPATLVTYLQLLLHNFSMNSCATLDYWLGVLEKEIRDVVVSKHSTHISEVEKLLRGTLRVKNMDICSVRHDEMDIFFCC